MNMKRFFDRAFHSYILALTVALLGGLALTLGLLWMLGQPISFAAAPVPGQAQKSAEKPLYAPLQASGWTWRKPITIYNSGTSVLTDYQVSLVITHASGMQNDFGDLRFLDADGNHLSYWVETYTHNISATVWVKMDSIPTPQATLNMYYGNSEASSLSDGEATFEFFDDFEGTSLDTTKWDTVSGSPPSSYKVENGYLKMWQNWGGCCGAACVYNRLNTWATFSTPIAVESNFMTSGDADQPAGCCYICYHTILSDTYFIGVSSQEYGFVFNSDDGPGTQSFDFPDQDVWHRITKIFGQDGLTVTTDYGAQYNHSGNVAAPGPIGLAGDTDLSELDGSDRVDWIAIRKYASPVPTITQGSAVQVPDLVVSKSATPEGVSAGERVTYTIIFSNVGDAAATGVVITDIVPDVVTNPTWDGSSNVSLDSDTYVWNVDDLGSGVGGVITVTGVVSEGLPAHTFTNIVTVTSAEEEYPDNNSDSVTVDYQSSGWTKMQPITIHNPSKSVLVDYQIALTIPYTDGMQADFDDLRFGDVDGNNLSYWIETYTPNEEATVWVKVSSIPTPTATINMYYGNSFASPVSDGEATFEFFDQFQGTGLDTAKWDTTNAPSQSDHYKVENGYLKMWDDWGGCCGLGGCVYNRLNTKEIFYDPIAVESRFRSTDPTIESCHICYHTILDGRDVIAVDTDSRAFGFQINNQSDFPTDVGFPSDQDWHRITKIFEEYTLTVQSDYAPRHSWAHPSDTKVAFPGAIGLAGDNDNVESESDQVDWIAIRKYVSATLTTTLGSSTLVPDLIVNKSISPEEPKPGGPITYTIVFTNVGVTAATDVVITDIVPADVNIAEVISCCVDINNTGATPPYVWEVEDLGYAEGGMITITGQVAGDLPEGQIIKNTAIASAAESEYPGNSSDAVTFSYFSSGWTRMRPITIYNSGTLPLTDYQVSLKIPYTDGMQTDFEDLRFGDANGNCLSYWTETYTSSEEATVWVKVPSIPVPMTTISMYYGNSIASSASNGEDTFEFFDSFEGTGLDADKWDDTNSPDYFPGDNGDYEVEDGCLKMWGDWGGCCGLSGCVYDRINTEEIFDVPIAVESRFRYTGDSVDACRICYHTILGDRDVIGVDTDSYAFGFQIDDQDHFSTAVSFPNDQDWHRITKIFEQYTLTVRSDYASEHSWSPGADVDFPGAIGLAGDNDRSSKSESDCVDWIAVRKHASPAPTTALGSPAQVPDLVVTKSAKPAVPNPGGAITYTVVFTNVGAAAAIATDVIITDRIPVSVTRDSLSYASDGVTIDATGGISYVWEVDDLSPRAQGVITIKGRLSDTLPGGHVFINEVIGKAAGECPCNNDDEVAVTVNYAPIATATVDQPYINRCVTTTLRGEASSDPDVHYPLTYRWRQTGGPVVEIANPFTHTTVFTGSCTEDGVVTFTLTVTDELGLASVTDIVTATVKNVPVEGLDVFNSSPTPPGSAVYFTATITEGSSVMYTWDFGDGDIGYSDDRGHIGYITHTYNSPPSTGNTYVVTVTASNTFGGDVYTNTATTTVTLIIVWPINGTVWDDTDDDSSFDAGESGIAGVRMFLYKEYSGCVASTSTDDSGIYTFTNVITGDYQIIEAYGHSNLGLDSSATYAAMEVQACDPAGLANDPDSHASNTPNVQWIKLNRDGSVENRASPSLWPLDLTEGVNFGDEVAVPFAACEDAFQTKGSSVSEVHLFKLDMLRAELDIYPPDSTLTYYDINSIGFNEADNYIYGYKRAPEKRFTRIAADGEWTELRATDNFVANDSYLGDITGEGCCWGENYWVIGDNGHKNLEIVDVDPSRPTFLMVVNTVMLDRNLVDADIAWNRVDDNFYVCNNSQQLYRITFDGDLDQAGTKAYMTHVANVNGASTGGSGAQYFDKSGGFYFYPNNQGKLYKISNVADIVAVEEVMPTLIATGDTVSLNDGAGCAPTVEFEYGDAPASYELIDKARHNYIFEDGIYLGSSQDGELEAQNSVDGLGDDADTEGDDDDGVTREGADWYDQALWANSSQFYTLTVNANKAGYLNVWLDLNGDSDWTDDGEQIADDLPLSAGINYAPTFSVTDDYTGTTFMRFRFTDEKAPTRTVSIDGVVTNGEVEDYLVTIDDCADLALTKTVVPTQPVPGGAIITFTVVVTNGGATNPECDGDATGVVVSDSLPSGYSYQTHTVSHGAYSYTTGLWEIGTITHNTAVTLDVVARVGGGDFENVAEVIDSGAFDPDSTPDNHWPWEDDQASASVEVLPIGGVAHPANKFVLLGPWIALAAIVAVTGGGLLLIRRRHRAREC